MKQIKPIQDTTEGNEATQLLVVSVNDDLLTFCNFDWKLFDTAGSLVDNGLLLCTGADYTNWSGNNEFPYKYVAANITKPLTIID